MKASRFYYIGLPVLTVLAALAVALVQPQLQQKGSKKKLHWVPATTEWDEDLLLHRVLLAAGEWTLVSFMWHQ